jgi:hypothetical protein
MHRLAIVTSFWANWRYNLPALSPSQTVEIGTDSQIDKRTP